MFKLSSSKLTQHLLDRAAQSRGRTIAACIDLPEDMDWWYYQEFGTVRSYVMEMPVTLPATMEFSKPTFLPYIGPPRTALHPPISPKKYITRILPEIREVINQGVANAFVKSDFDPNAAQDHLISEVMPKVVEMIAESMGESLTQPREDGKLKGIMPADEYRAKAQITDKST